MDQTPATISKTRRIRPLIYSHLVTSTPDSYQVAKRVKRLFGYSERYKGNSSGFSSLRSRDYRKARELNLELWSPAKKSDFLEKFLKTQKNVDKIRIRIINEYSHKELLTQFLKSLCKMRWLNRLHIDFEKEQNGSAWDLARNTKCLRFLPKLKDWAITVDGKQRNSLSESLFRIGFNVRGSNIEVKCVPEIEKLMKKVPKFHQLDTIKVDNQSGSLRGEFLDDLKYVISKLPNFKELDLNSSSAGGLSFINSALNLLETLFKAPRFEIFRIGIQALSKHQISLLKHPVFATKFLRRVHLSLLFQENIPLKDTNPAIEALQEIPGLYELNLDFSQFSRENDKIAENLKKTLCGLTSLRKLKIIFGIGPAFDHYREKKLDEKQAGSMIQSIFNGMPFIEELELKLPKNGLDFGERNGEDIQGLPRLTKACFSFTEYEARMEKSIWGLIGVLGKCHRLRELEMDLTDSVYDYEGTAKQFHENLVKLKGLQVFKLQAYSREDEQIPVSLFKDFVMTFDKMRDLQDWSLGLMRYINSDQDRPLFRVFYDEMAGKKKYRFFDLGTSLRSSLRNRNPSRYSRTSYSYLMDQTSASIPQTKRINPLIYTHLVTSTPDSFQVTKRIKRIIGYSEHYKGNSSGFSSLRSRDYRKARELNLELWSPAHKTDLLEKFLKAQKNVEKIRIRIIKENFSKELLEQFLKVLSKMSWLNRLHIDFEKEQSYQEASFFIHQIKYLKPFPKLKDWEVTVDGEEPFPFSASLSNLGFYCQYSSIVSKSEPVIAELMKKTPKFHQLDTLRVDSRKLGSLPNKFLDRLAFVISKLPDFRQLNLNYSRDLFLSPKPALKIFDILMKAQRFEILKIGTQMKEASQISILKHPLFQAHSLKRTHLSLFFTKGISPEDLNQTLDLVQEIPSLCDLYLDFSLYPNMNDKISKALMEKLGRLTRLRKLKIVFDHHTKKISEKQAGRIIRWIFNSMPFIEELCLYLPKNGLDLGEKNGENIQGLPKLRRVLISLTECDEKMEKHVFGLIGILGKCQRLRELEMDLTGSVYENLGMTKKFCEILVKLKGLQAFKLLSRKKEISVYLLKNFSAIFDQMRDLQDWSLGVRLNIKNKEEQDWLIATFSEMRRKEKYRFIDLDSSLAHSWRPF